MRFVGCFLLAAALVTRVVASEGTNSDSRGIQFVAFTNFSGFEKTEDTVQHETIFTSPRLQTKIAWDQLIASWDVHVPTQSWVRVEVRGFLGNAPTRFYNMGVWSGDPKERRSAHNENDSDGEVSTDTLILKKPSLEVQLRFALGGDDRSNIRIKFAGLCLTDTKATNALLPPNKAAWGMTIDVPERSQMAYPNGKVLCSPTTVSMVMTYWSRELKRPELDHDVPDIVKQVYDANWHGAGNWPFNTAYAGGYPGMRGYVTRMSDVSELEDWIAAGLPVALSLCYDRLRGKGPGPNGHLVVCVGFTENGDVLINDPGTSKNVRKTFPRKNLIYAWANSRNAAYLIYPEAAKVPFDRFGHWASNY